MDDWRMQQQSRRLVNQIGPMQTARVRPSPYPTYQYQSSSSSSSSTVSVQNETNPNVYYPPSMEQRFISRKISTHPSHQQMLSARARAMPYPSPSMYTHPSNSMCQYSSHPMYYSSSYSTKSDDSSLSSLSYHPSTYSNSYIPAQQLTPISHEYPTYTSPSSNPSTPYQGEFNTSTEFGVPYHHGQPSSVNSLTDALCPSENSIDRQLTPGPPSVGTPRVAQHQYSFPQTPSTPSSTTSRLSTEQNIDELTAFLQDPVNMYLTDDFASTLYDDIEVLANTYLGGSSGRTNAVDNDFDYDIILNYLCSDDLISTLYKN